MSINFPSTLDSLPNPTNTDLMENATLALDHDQQHSNANDAIEALEAKVGANSSAVTTSHDYKLSGVTGSDKAVSKTGTETLTNKTLTAPQINFGSDANGDLLYRNGSGVTSRLAIGTTDQILAVQAGVPTWVANPSASPASTTVAGIVELATTAETETGTDATRAVTPDGLHDMTTLAGAAWFLDEDTMSSDSATKTASQQSIKAYIDSIIAGKNGTTTKDASDASTTQNIAHGLGRIPKRVRITAIYSANNASSDSVPFPFAMTVYNGTTQSSLSAYPSSATGVNYTTSTSFTLNITHSGSPDTQTGVVTFDSTNIIITWTKTNSPTGTYNLLWEAQ